jgi:hypothetical protein
MDSRNTSPDRGNADKAPTSTQVLMEGSAMDLTVAANGYVGFHMQNNNRTSRINDADLNYMHGFPMRRKQRLMEEIMSRTPVSNSVVEGHNHYEKTILKLRKDGFQLIDLQPQEFVLTSVWCRNTRSVIGLPRVEVAMLLWVVEEEVTNVTRWRI